MTVSRTASRSRPQPEISSPERLAPGIPSTATSGGRRGRRCNWATSTATRCGFTCNLPFLLGEPGVQTTDIPSITLDGRTLRGLRAEFSAGIHTHCPDTADAVSSTTRDFCGGMTIKSMSLAGRLAAHLVSDYVEVKGCRPQHDGESLCGTRTGRSQRIRVLCRRTCLISNSPGLIGRQTSPRTGCSRGRIPRTRADSRHVLGHVSSNTARISRRRAT